MTDTDIARARADLYAFISALFSYPTTEKFAALFDGDYRNGIKRSANRLDGYDDGHPTGLAESIERLFHALPDGPQAVEEGYIRVFGHTLSKDTAPYELEHLVITEVYQRTQRLADIGGFYTAFGLEIDTLERADHISVQAEFMAWLCLKEGHAATMPEGEEMLAVTGDAQRKFWRDHFGGWVPVFSQTLLAPTVEPFYRASAEFLGCFLDGEASRLEPESLAAV